MRPRALATIFVAATTVFFSACAHVVAGRAVYATEIASSGTRLVKPSELPSLLLTTADIGAIIGAPALAATGTFASLNELPAGFVSDPKCAGALTVGEEITYRGSHYLYPYRQEAEDQHNRHVFEGVVAFGGADDAQALVDSTFSHWKDCEGRPLAVTEEGVQRNFWAFGPTRSDGVNVLLLRQEGGGGAGCAHTIAARSNVVGEVQVCGRDETVLNGQAAKIVNAILAKISQ
jgi:serine/threonine kinase PknH